MKSLLCKINKRSGYFYGSFILFFSSLFFTFTIFSSSLTRMIVSLRNLFTSVMYWFFFCYEGIITLIFGRVPKVNITLFDLSSFSIDKIAPIDFIGLQARLERFSEALGSRFREYNLFLYNFLFFPAFIICNSLIVLVLLYLIFKKIILSKNDRPNGYISKPARYYIFLLKKTILPLRGFIINFIEYLKAHKWIIYLTVCIWLLNFNIVSIILNVFAFYYYFICSFNFGAFFVILNHIIGDTVIMMSVMPLLYWLCAAVYIYYRVHYNKGLDKLRHMEAMNCGYLKTLDVVTLIIGEPGMGKTTWLADAFLSWENIFKDENLNTMFKYELYFPAFPFSAFREDLLSRIDTHELFCLPNVEDYVDLLIDFHEIMEEDGFIYGYDTKVFPESVNVGNRIIPLREALKDYGKCFMMYCNPNVGVANFPIRSDGCHDDSNRLKLWDGDFFQNKEKSYYSHILNQDMLRQGKKVDPTSAEIGAFGYGVYGWAEISKDLGNQNTNAHLKADAEKANAKNEKITYSFMFARHAKTLVDNFVYVRFLTDDQRAANIMAEAVGLMSVINIKSKSEMKLAIDGFNFVFTLEEKICDPFDKFLRKRENVRGDITLFILLLKQITSGIKLGAAQLKNCFGYEELTLLRQQGNAFSGNTGATNAAGEGSEHVYYKSYWKDYSDRFQSDSHASVFAEAQKACGIGLTDIPCYQGKEMTPEEMEYQRSRLTSELLKMLKHDEKNN